MCIGDYDKKCHIMIERKHKYDNYMQIIFLGHTADVIFLAIFRVDECIY